MKATCHPPGIPGWLDLGGPSKGVQLRVVLLTAWSRMAAPCLLDWKELPLLVKLMGLVDTAAQDTGHALRFIGGYDCLV